MMGYGKMGENRGNFALPSPPASYQKMCVKIRPFLTQKESKNHDVKQNSLAPMHAPHHRSSRSSEAQHQIVGHRPVSPLPAACCCPPNNVIPAMPLLLVLVLTALLASALRPPPLPVGRTRSAACVWCTGPGPALEENQWQAFGRHHAGTWAGLQTTHFHADEEVRHYPLLAPLSPPFILAPPFMPCVTQTQEASTTERLFCGVQLALSQDGQSIRHTNFFVPGREDDGYGESALRTP